MNPWKAIFLLAGGIFLFLTGCATSEEAKQKANAHFRLGTQYLQQNDSSSALRELLEAEKLDPRNADIHFALGWAYGAKGRYPQALEQYQEVLKIDPHFTEAHNASGAIYLELGKWDDAIQAFDHALKDILYLTPYYVLNNMGWAYYKKGDRGQAIECYKKALAMKPDFGLAHYNLGLAYKDNQQPVEAIAAFRAAIAHAPSLVDGQYQLGVLLFKSGRKEEAKKPLQEVIRLSPKSESARLAQEYLDLLQKSKP
jgi:type IV pilus assembly protein PilF